ncbi:MAG: ThiF family adenylyltransferase [Candidatus Eiseniibacteriota bacterium]
MDPFERQRDLLHPKSLDHLDLDLAGAGALGGAILLCLCRMGFGIFSRITLTDFDRCELHNLPTQWFRETDVRLERLKVDALADLAAWITDREITTVSARFTGAEERQLGPIVILAVDSLQERRRIWSNLRARDDVRVVIDARAGAEVVEVWTVEPRGPGQAEYEQDLEGEAHEEPCTRRMIAYGPLFAASLVGSVLRAWVQRERCPTRLTADLRNFRIDRSPAA